ncbi:uncharacterized protein LOC108039761 [Drosophila rhopaloa]|uniref:MD-2-related lipid-recognition domain-containing protein n=2 Tax=Drosophila rhopaloa TaxID=1041015 RepID=A0ABM5GZS6_DRORH|nr:uncharacterized protein LOC108039761 [Drosophila rhopaloa]
MGSAYRQFFTGARPWIIFGVSILFAFLVCSEAPFAKMTNAVCKSLNESWVVFHYCRLKAYSRNKTSLHLNATFLEPTNNVFVRIRVMKKANGYKPFLVDVTINGCQFLRKNNNPIFKIIYNMIKDVSTANHTCPFVGLQTISDFHVLKIPVPLPTGDYLLLMDCIFYDKMQFITNVYLTYVEDLLETRKES